MANARARARAARLSPSTFPRRLHVNCYAIIRFSSASPLSVSSPFYLARTCVYPARTCSFVSFVFFFFPFSTSPAQRHADSDAVDAGCPPC